MFNKILNGLYWLLLIVLLVIAGSTALSALGLPQEYKLFVVQSGSMEPTIRTGGLVVVKPESQYKKDDIITFKIQPQADIKNPNLLITHRIVDIKDINGQTFFITKGDANNTPDMEQRPLGNVLGKVIFSIPYLGYPVGFAKTQNGFILLIVIPSTIIVYSELMTIKNETIKLLKERKKRRLTLGEKVEVEIGEEEIKIEKWYQKLYKKIFNKSKK
jgi:signal peptidase